MPVPFPTTVRVGYRTFKIERWDTTKARAAHCTGQMCPFTATISVDATRIDQEPIEAGNTLLHEIMHACWLVGGVSDDDKEERTVAILTNQLCQVWRDNPDVIAYLTESSK